MFNSPPQIFYHAFGQGLRWKEIATEQIDRMIDSGLLTAGHLHANCHFNLNDWQPFIERYKEFSNHITWYQSPGTPQDKEVATFRLMHDVASKDINVIFPMLYIHPKGIMYEGLNGCIDPAPTYWRRYLDYWAVTRWRDCVAKLEEGYDTCGVERREPNMPGIQFGHYSGSTHWVNSQFFRKIPKLGMPSLGEQVNSNPLGEQSALMAGEMIYGTANDRWFSFHQFNQNLYAFVAQPSEYQRD